MPKVSSFNVVAPANTQEIPIVGEHLIQVSALDVRYTPNSLYLPFLADTPVPPMTGVIGNLVTILPNNNPPGRYHTVCTLSLYASGLSMSGASVTLMLVQNANVILQIASKVLPLRDSTLDTGTLFDVTLTALASVAVGDTIDLAGVLTGVSAGSLIVQNAQCTAVKCG